MALDLRQSYLSAQYFENSPNCICALMLTRSRLGLLPIIVRTACDIQADGRRGPGRPIITWNKLTQNNCHEWKLATVNPQERSIWISGVRSAVHTACQLPRIGATDVDDCPAP